MDVFKCYPLSNPRMYNTNFTEIHVQQNDVLTALTTVVRTSLNKEFLMEKRVGIETPRSPDIFVLRGVTKESVV